MMDPLSGAMPSAPLAQPLQDASAALRFADLMHTPDVSSALDMQMVSAVLNSGSAGAAGADAEDE